MEEVTAEPRMASLQEVLEEAGVVVVVVAS
jgi:hypothetical protein